MELFDINYLKNILNNYIATYEYQLDNTSLQESKLKYNVFLNVFKSFNGYINNHTDYKQLCEYRDMLSKSEDSYELIIKGIDETNRLRTYLYNREAYHKLHLIVDSYIKSFDVLGINYSNLIINKLMNNEEVYDLINNRRLILTNISLDNQMDSLNSIESLESQISSFIEVKAETYILNKNEYVSILKNSINAINDYYFLDFKKSNYYKSDQSLSEEKNKEFFKNRFDLYNRRVKTLLNSLNTKIELSVDDNIISVEDLLNYLINYNIDGNYTTFKRSMKDKTIDGKIVTRSEYEKTILLINNYLNELYKFAFKKIKGKIEVVDNLIDRNDLIKFRNDYLEELKKKVYERNNDYEFK